jgi:hypothetical protein
MFSLIKVTYIVEAILSTPTLTAGFTDESLMSKICPTLVLVPLHEASGTFSKLIAKINLLEVY